MTLLSYLIGLASLSFTIITRHDIKDEKFTTLALQYPQVCHFPMGEGTLIRNNWILTAGHVGKDLQKDLARGDLRVMCNGNEYSVTTVIVHPSFSDLRDGLKHDISLVKIAGNVKNVQPAKLYTRSDEVGKMVTIVGRGDKGTGLTGPQKWDKVTRAATNRIDKAEAGIISFDFDGPAEKTVTPLEGISGPGDSGGPAFIGTVTSPQIAGISSHQKGGATLGKGRYGVTEYYTRVSSYSKWIEQTILSDTTTTNKKQAVAKDADSRLKEYAGTYGFRKIILKGSDLFFQRDDEPLIPMKEIAPDNYLWDDGNTRIVFKRNPEKKITGFEIRRRNGEVVDVARN